MSDFRLFLKDEDAQLKLAASMAQHTTAGCVVFLQGDLGAGKNNLRAGVFTVARVQGKC